MSFKGTVESDFMKLVKDFQNLKTDLIDYAGSDFNSLRLNLVRYIQSVYPVDYNNFVSSDLGGMLIDLVAYVGAVTSMKADFLANENYLRTAKNRNSIKKLLELIGVRLRGPTSAIANASLTFSTDPFSEQPEGTIEIPYASRTVTITSPEDGQQISYTLYKTQNGLIDLTNKQSTISLTKDESEGGLGLVFKNFVLIEGALVRKTGRFDAANGIKTVGLDYSPVVEGSVEVFVEGNADTRGNYTQIDNLFYVTDVDAKVFQLVSDDDFRSNVVFADNIIAKSPSPNDEFTVLYRVGGGTRGNLAKNFINIGVSVTNSGGVPTTAIVENFTQATGGGNAETIEHAKKYAPLSFRRQDRLVTLNDYESFCNTFTTSYGSVAKSTVAVRRAFSSANIIDIYLLEKANDLQLKKASPAFKKELLDQAEPKKMLTDDIVVVDGLIRTLDLVITIRVSKELKEDEEVIKNDVALVIQNYFNVENRAFGQTFVPQDLAREIFALSSVIFATVDNYQEPVQVDFNEFIQLNNFSINIVRV